MLLVSLLIPLVYFLPSGFLLATASQSVSRTVEAVILDLTYPTAGYQRLVPALTWLHGSWECDYQHGKYKLTSNEPCTDATSFQLSKSYSLQTLLTSNQITQDMKLGHYMKIPPRRTFTGMHGLPRHRNWSLTGALPYSAI